MVHDVQLVAVRRDARRTHKLAVAPPLAPEGVAPGEVGAEDDDAVVAAVAHIHSIRHHAQAPRLVELPLATALALIV